MVRQAMGARKRDGLKEERDREDEGRPPHGPIIGVARFFGEIASNEAVRE